MALRDQPYLPLFVQDFLTDEKLIECSASATGIYIRLLCIMHKSDEYGTIMLKQKDKQTDNQIKNFALKLAKFLPYNDIEIKDGLEDLIREGVLKIEEDKLLQKRMIRDNEISIIRSKAGKKGGDKNPFAQAKRKAKAEAKTQANTEYEYEDENVIDSLIEDLYKSVVIFFDEDCRPKDLKQKQKWCDTLDKLIRIDGYTPEYIINIVKRTRMDDFWRLNFLTINKLRDKKDGISYFKRFEKKINHENTIGNNKGATVEEIAGVIAAKFGSDR
jgi:uncharacterized protein YdaU (DUF1376 family)